MLNQNLELSLIQIGLGTFGKNFTRETKCKIIIQKKK